MTEQMGAYLPRRCFGS